MPALTLTPCVLLLVSTTPMLPALGWAAPLQMPCVATSAPLLLNPALQLVPTLICAPSKFHTPALALTMPAPLDRLI